MQLAIPSTPRPVRLSQIPGALRRLALMAGGAALVTLVGWGGVLWAQRSLGAQRDFLDRAVEVQGQVAEVSLPKVDERATSQGHFRAVYRLAGKDYAASRIEVSGLEAEKLFVGARVTLLVDPAAPSRAQEAATARASAGWLWLGSLILGLGVLLGVGLVALEGRRAVRREVAPLRLGALVWLTPDGPLPDTRAELRFTGTYFRDDVKKAVTAWGRPGRRPVRNQEKVLAAVLPDEPKWARVVDEELARVLGWYR